MSYPWFKMHSKGWLTGTIRATMTIEERSVWADLLAMASESRVRGVICRAVGAPYTREYMASFLGVPIGLLNSTISKCLADQNDEGDYHRIEIDETGCIHIMNWDRYQSGKDGKAEQKSRIPLSPQDRDASQQAAAARLGFLQPDAAQRGVRNRRVEEAIKVHNKKLRKEGG